MKVLLSIKPEFADKIFSGKKQFEFRKSLFKRSEVNCIVIYVTLPVGKVMGEFNIESIIEDTPSNVWEETKAAAGITRKFFHSYFEGRERAFAIKIGEIKKYDEPLELSALGSNIFAPQSFRYLTR